jgi:hypothetical protein
MGQRTWATLLVGGATAVSLVCGFWRLELFYSSDRAFPFHLRERVWLALEAPGCPTPVAISAFNR